MNYIAFGFGLLVGFCISIIGISLLCMASARSRELEESERAELRQINNGPN